MAEVRALDEDLEDEEHLGRVCSLDQGSVRLNQRLCLHLELAKQLEMLPPAVREQVGADPRYREPLVISSHCNFQHSMQSKGRQKGAALHVRGEDQIDE